MKKSIILGISILSVFILCSLSYQPIVADDAIQSNNKNIVEYNNPILHFYFDKQGWNLYLENIGDEIAYNITLSIHIYGLIVFGNEEDYFLRIGSLEPDDRMGIIYFPLVFGFGPIKAIYTADAVNADPTSITLKAFLIGPWPFLWGYYEKLSLNIPFLEANIE